MTKQESGNTGRPAPPASLHDALIRLDRATELLEGLEELGVDSRQELQDLMERLERQIDEAE